MNGQPETVENANEIDITASHSESHLQIAFRCGWLSALGSRVSAIIFRSDFNAVFNSIPHSPLTARRARASVPECAPVPGAAH